MQERNLALSSEGIKMTVASEHPHFVDILGTGVVIYHLKVTNCYIYIHISSNARMLYVCFTGRADQNWIKQ